MRQRLSTIGIILLVATIVLIGVTGCSRQAKERQPDATEAAGAGTPVASPAGNTSPAPGETVVSAVTPSGQSPGAAPTVPTVPAPAGQTPAAPLATAGPPPGEATAVAPPPASPGGSIWHTVQPGETLSSIARRYGTSWQAIAQANGLTNPNQIYVGQKLTIPTSGSGGSSGGSGCRIRHTVKQGDWVWQIARNYGVSPYDILAANGLSIQAANTILPGTVLCIP